VGWVTQGYQALENPEQVDGGDAKVVFVSAYRRERDGRTEHVSAYVQTRHSEKMVSKINHIL
jgi:hypothetical protein